MKRYSINSAATAYGITKRLKLAEYSNYLTGGREEKKQWRERVENEWKERIHQDSGTVYRKSEA
jgi:hypothetical protein